MNGYGTSVSGAWRLGRLRDTIVFQGIGGKGIANYYNDNYGLGSDVGFDAQGRLVATPTWSATVGYQHYWTRIVRSTASYGYLRINNTAADPARIITSATTLQGISSFNRPLSTCSAQNTSMRRFAEKMISNGSRLAFKPASHFS